MGQILALQDNLKFDKEIKNDKTEIFTARFLSGKSTPLPPLLNQRVPHTPTTLEIDLQEGVCQLMMIMIVHDVDVFEFPRKLEDFTSMW